MKLKAKFVRYCLLLLLNTYIPCALCSCSFSDSFSQKNQPSQVTNKYTDTEILLSSSQNSNIANKGTVSIFTETFKVTLEEILDASLNHLSSHYIIDSMYIEKENTQNAISPVHVIKASFITNTPTHVLNCGTVKDEALLPDGNRFSYVYQGADSPVFTMEKRNDLYMNASKTLSLKGEVTLTIQEIALKRVSVSVLTKYTLKQEIIYTPLKNTRTLFREKSKEQVYNSMQFYTGETGIFYPDTFMHNETTYTLNDLDNSQNMPTLPIKNSIQCQAKCNIEESILQAIENHFNK